MRTIQAVPDDLDEGVQIERLEDRIADRVDRNLIHAPFSGGGEDDDVRSLPLIPLAYLLDELVPVETGHHQVEEDQVEPAILLQLLQTDRPILGQVDVELHPLEDRVKKDADGKIVIDDENPSSGSIQLLYGHRPAATFHLLRKTYTGLRRFLLQRTERERA